MLKTKGFSSNNSLKRRAIIVDAPDLPPEECEFYITGAGVADTDKVYFSESPKLDFNVETLYEDNDNQLVNKSSSDEVQLIQVKGIGKGTVEYLSAQGIKTISDLLEANPEELAASISGASVKKVNEWQSDAKVLINS